MNHPDADPLAGAHQDVWESLNLEHNGHLAVDREFENEGRVFCAGWVGKATTEPRLKRARLAAGGEGPGRAKPANGMDTNKMEHERRWTKNNRERQQQF